MKIVYEFMPLRAAMRWSILQRIHRRKIYAERGLILVVVRTVRCLDCRGAQQKRKACLYCYAEKRVTRYRNLHRGFQHAIFAV